MRLNTLIQPDNAATTPSFKVSIADIAHDYTVTKNTQLSFLKHVRINDLIEIETDNQKRLTFRVTKVEIAHQDICKPNLLPENNEKQQLELITSYPFDSMSFRGPLRYKITASALH